MSRRGALALVGGGALLVGVLTAGQTLGGPRATSRCCSRVGGEPGVGPNGFPINRTAAAAGIDAAGDRRLDGGWR